MTTSSRPSIVPEITPLTAPYWDGAAVGELRIQFCTHCGAQWHPPQPICPTCHRTDRIAWKATLGRGTVDSFTWVHHAAHASVAGRLPYVVALIALAEGPKVIANILDATMSNLAVGHAVRAVFEPIPGTDLTLPQFNLDSPDS